MGNPSSLLLLPPRPVAAPLPASWPLVRRRAVPVPLDQGKGTLGILGSPGGAFSLGIPRASTF